MTPRPIDGGFEISAPAKLNLFLEITGRRPDGYHELVSLMVATDLTDRIVVLESEGTAISLQCDDTGLPVDSSNLVVKAAELIKRHTGISAGATIHLHKSIPAQAGLGGGSSDAAATLVALDRLWGTNLSIETLSGLAGRIGSDCAFFLHGPAAICRGRGELVEPIATNHSYSFVLVNPEFGVSTAEVYRNLNLARPTRSVENAVQAFLNGNTRDLGRELYNRLQPVAESIAPALRRVGEALLSLVPSHLDGILMSGSGSTCFGLASTPDAAIAAARSLSLLGLGRVRVVKSEP